MMKESSNQQGFTLIEVMITMVVALVMLAGMTSLFLSQTRVANMMNGKTEAMGDLFLVSQIMQLELRGAQAICWDDTNNRLVYQPLTSTANITGCGAPVATNGSFELGTSDLCWDRPDTDAGNCQELMRNLPTDAGMIVTPTGNSDPYALRTITLSSMYQNMDRDSENLQLTFKVWPRN